MNKKTVIRILLDSVFLIVFNVIFFLTCGDNNPMSVWISYAFIHFAYFMVILTPILVRQGKSSAVFSFSLYAISSVYFFAEFIVGVFFILIHPEGYKAALITQILIGGFYAALLLLNLLVNEKTADDDDRQESEMAFIREASSQLKVLINKAKQKKVQKEIERAYDYVHSSPSKSTQDAHVLESAVMDKIGELREAVLAQDEMLSATLAKEVVELAEERNRCIRAAQ